MIAPVSETTGQDPDFGWIIVGSKNSRLTVPATSDTIIVSSENAIPVGGSATRARLDVIAPPLTLIIIALPSSIQLQRVSGSDQMKFDQFDHNDTAIKIMDASGQLFFLVSGPLSVAEAQAAGVYNGTFIVTVTVNLF